MVVIMPVCIIIFIFLLVFLSFYFIMGRHIDALTQDSMKLEFEIMDEIFSDKENDDYILWGMEDSTITVPIEYMILDDNKNVIFSSEYFYLQKGLETIEFIAQYVSENALPQDEKSVKINIEDKTYLISGKYYEGIYEDAFVTKAKAGEKADTYLYVVYMDITQIQVLMNTINQSLLVVLICIGGLSIIFIFKTIKKVRVSFRTLDRYLVKIGKRENVQEIPQFPYEEFSNIVKTVDEMSHRIAQSEQLQKQFFQNASHELRTPLMSIQGYAEGLKYNVIKDTANSYDVILEESKRMSDLVDEILFLSKFETQTLKNDTIEVDNMLYACGNQVYIHAYTHIDIFWNVPKDITIIGDETLLQRAFSNILSNALRYAKSKVCINCVVENEILKIHIIDDGDGITEQDLPHIFERFYKGKGGNFGIGLSMTKDIIDKYKGVITVNSKPGYTDFCVEIPIS